MKDYKTVHAHSTAEMVEKKSRFIGHCKPVKSEDEAIAFINEVKSSFKDATHNVYAYILRENNLMRYSDDGEPSGTAGLPVLDILRKENLTDVAIVVTRYFGGTLLGTGGLVRAYSKSAKLAIDSAKRVNKLFCNIYCVETDYSMQGKIQYAILEGGYILQDTMFTDTVKFIVCVKEDQSDAFINMITEASFGAVNAVLIASEYIETEVEETYEI